MWVDLSHGLALDEIRLRRAFIVFGRLSFQNWSSDHPHEEVHSPYNVVSHSYIRREHADNRFQGAVVIVDLDRAPAV